MNAIESLGDRTRTLEVAEQRQAGNGAPAHFAMDGTEYWDYTNSDLYINDSGLATYGNSWQLIGGGGGPGFPHSILSATHVDTTPAVVVRGDVMTGQGVAPTWQRLAHPGAATQFLQSNALEPGWTAITALGGVPALTYGLVDAAGVATTFVQTDASLAIFDAVVPTTIQADDAAATGAQPFAARRDHTHGMPTVAPVNIGVANAEGTADDFVRSDHVHNHPAGLGVNLHHNEVHTVNSAGPHAEAGLTIGHVLRVSGAAAFSFAAIQVGDLPAHDILSATHGDTTPAAVQQGDLMTGQAGPTWARLPLGASCSVLHSDGTDVEWSTLAALGIVDGGGAANRVAYWTGPNTIASDAGLLVDAANDMFIVADGGGTGIGAALERIVFDVAGDISVMGDAVAGINFGVNTLNPDRVIHGELSIGVNNAVTCAERLSILTASWGVPAVAGFGTGIEFELEENDTTMRVAGIIEVLWTDAGEGVNADADLVFKLMENDAAAAERVRFTSDGGIQVPDSSWHGIGPALERIVFDAAGYVSVMGAYFGAGVLIPEAPIHAQTTGTAVTNFLILEGDRNVSDTEVGILFKDRNVIAGGQEVARIWTDRSGGLGDFDLVFQAGNQALAGLQAESIRIQGDTGFVGFNTVPDRQTHAEASDAVTAAVTYAQRLTHITSGTAAAGFGVGIEFELEDGGGANVIAGALQVVWSSPSATTRARYELWLDSNGTRYLSAVIEGRAAGAGVAVGNARGWGAVDLQGLRSAATQVASGSYSVIGGGSNCTASNPNSTVAGGNLCIASNNIATVGGGSTNTASGYGATIAGGSRNVASADFSVAGGYYCVADKYGQLAHASGQFVAPGDAQGTPQFTARRSVTHSDANWYELFLDGAAQRMTVAADTVWTFDTLITGTTQGCTKSFGFRIKGTIENDGGTTTLLASTVTTIYDGDDVSFDARASADDPNDALLIEVQDSDGTGDTVRWVACTRTAEVTYA